MPTFDFLAEASLGHSWDQRSRSRRVQSSDPCASQPKVPTHVFDLAYLRRHLLHSRPGRPGGKLFVLGEATNVGFVFFAFHTGEYLVRRGDTIPGLGGPIASVTSPHVSPNGEHWTASVTRLAGNLDALFSNGEFLDDPEAAGRSLVGTLLLELPNGQGTRQALVRLQLMFEGTVTCAGVPNSTGQAGLLTAFGTSSVSANELTLVSFDLPTGSFGYALASEQAGLTFNPGGSAGNLCLAGSIGRFLQDTFVVGEGGQATVGLDLTAFPQPLGSTAVMAGDVWYLQLWHRDTSASGPTSNFSNAVSVTFTP